MDYFNIEITQNTELITQLFIYIQKVLLNFNLFFNFYLESFIVFTYKIKNLIKIFQCMKFLIF